MIGKKLFGWKSANPDGSDLLRAWRFSAQKPGGRAIFSRMVGVLIPYTGTIRAEILELEEGRARVRMGDRRGVRNHLNSVHAIALANLGEFSTGLATLTAAGAGARSILKSIRTEYLKKARGTLEATATFTPFVATEKKEIQVRGEIKNLQGEIVAVVEAVWVVGPASA